MYGYIYLVHDSLNNKFYIGMHKYPKFEPIESEINTTASQVEFAYLESKGFPYFKIDKNYIGSGKYLKNAIRKYGKEWFYILDILDIANSKKELCDKEKYWISEYRRLGYDLYNISDGGYGGFNLDVKGKNNPMYGNHHNIKTKQKISNSLKGKQAWNKGKHNIYSKETLNKMSNSKKKLVGKLNPQFGLKRSEETKNKMKEAKKNRTRVTDGYNIKFIKNEELDYYLKNGWRKGSLTKYERERNRK